MKYINELREGNRISGIYLCKHKQSAVTKNGNREFEALDYVDIMGDVSSFNGALQVSIKNARKAEEGEYNPADYLPTSRYDINTMYQELLSWIGTVKNQYLSELLTYYFIQDQETAKRFRMSSAAKSVHHGFVGGLLEHTLSVPFLRFYGKIVSDSEPRSADYGSNSARYRKDERTLLIPAERLHQ